MSETSSSEQDTSQEVLRAIFKRDKTYDNELRRYNEIGELLIDNGTTGSAGTSKLSGVVWETSVTRALSAWGVKEMGM